MIHSDRIGAMDTTLISEMSVKDFMKKMKKALDLHMQELVYYSVKKRCF